MYTHHAGPKQRIIIGRLAISSPQDVVAWLEQNWQNPDPSYFESVPYNRGIGYIQFVPNEHERIILEYMLTRRGEKLIEWGVACYGFSLQAIQRVYDRGDASTQLAAIANPYGNIELRQADGIPRSGRTSAMFTLLENQHLSRRFLEDLLLRKDVYSDIPDTRFQLIICALSKNQVFCELRNPRRTEADWWSDETGVWLAAWKLVDTVPATQDFAGALNLLLANCTRINFTKDLESSLARWHIDYPGSSKDRSQFFYLRSLVADFLPADLALREANDEALRLSFYRRFEPSKHKSWPEFLKQDGAECIKDALRNSSLWRLPEDRKHLWDLCAAANGSSTSLSLMDDYSYMEKKWQISIPRGSQTIMIIPCSQNWIESINELGT